LLPARVCLLLLKKIKDAHQDFLGKSFSIFPDRKLDNFSQLAKNSPRLFPPESALRLTKRVDMLIRIRNHDKTQKPYKSLILREFWPSEIIMASYTD
jgi:hypothetical protein